MDLRVTVLQQQIPLGLSTVSGEVPVVLILYMSLIMEITEFDKFH
jgi:hypothetical protein